MSAMCTWPAPVTSSKFTAVVPGLRLRSKTAGVAAVEDGVAGNSGNDGWCGMDFATQPIAQQVVRAEKMDRRMKTGVQPFSYTSPPLLLQRYTYMY